MHTGRVIDVEAGFGCELLWASGHDPRLLALSLS